MSQFLNVCLERKILKDLKILEARYKNIPVYIIVDQKETVALKMIADSEPIWISQLSWGWSTLDRDEAERVLQELSDSK